MMRFERFTERAQDAAARAYEILQRYGHNQVDTEHIFMALVEQPDGLVQQVLKQIDVDVDAFHKQMDDILRANPKAAIYGGGTGQVFITPRVKRIIDLANEEANRLRDDYISTAHLFLAVLSERNTAVSKLLADRGITRDRVEELVIDEADTNNPLETERFSEQAQLTTTRAHEILQHFEHDKIDTEHLLLALLQQQDGRISKILEQLGVDTNTLRNQLDGILRTVPKRPRMVTNRAARVMKAAGKMAGDQKAEAGISVEHLFLAILQEQNSITSKLMSDHGITTDRVNEAMNGTSSEGQSQS